MLCIFSNHGAVHGGYSNLLDCLLVALFHGNGYLIKNLKRLPGRWPKPDYVAEQLRLAISYALFGKKTVKQALDDCASAIEAQIGKDWAKQT